MPETDAVPCSGADAIAMLLKKPVILAVRFIAVAVLNATEATLLAVTGAGGDAMVRVTVAGVVVPPGPVTA